MYKKEITVKNSNGEVIRQHEEKLFDVYELKENNSKSFDSAYSDFCRDDQYPWCNENRESKDRFCEIFPIETTDWEYGYHVYVESKFTLDCYNYDTGYDYEDEFYGMTGDRLAKYLRKNYSDFLNGNCPFTGYYMDEVLLSPLKEFLNNPNEDYDFGGLLEECLEKWIHACNDDYVDYYSEENFIEMSNANDWLYNENGKIA